MSDHLRISGQRPIETGLGQTTSTKTVSGKDKGRKVSALIKRFESKPLETKPTTGPKTTKKPEELPKQRTIKPHRSKVKWKSITKSNGPKPKDTTSTTEPSTKDKYSYKEYVQKFGSKTANLYEIEKLGVKVPERSPISSDDVLEHLLDKDEDGVIMKSWTAMKSAGKIDDENIKRITDKIEEIFNESDFPFTEDQLKWINETMAGKVLIARSTGDEDSVDTPNAGGNESVLFVEPNTQSVKDAMKEVVLSYFGADSLRNRIVGDGVETVLSELPKMPVLLMEMIAEPIKDSSKLETGDPPPVGIAMSTDKLEFTGGEDFHFVSISSAVGPGVNEGNGQVEVDETFVMQSSDGTPLLIYQKPSVKLDRIRAVKGDDGIKNQLQKNSTKLAYNPSLSRDEVRSLVTSSDKIKTLNGGKTTEVEAVVGGDGTINFVQHRAIPDQRSQVDPTYVNIEKSTDHSDVFKYTTVVPKSGDALVITDWSQVCFAETMKEAEGMFDWKGGSQKIVIVRQPDGANSHPAVNFGSYKKDVNGTKEPNPIPCLVVPNFDELVALKKTALSDTQPLVVDGQSQKLFVWNDKSFNQDEAILDGRISHHIGLDTSVTDPTIQDVVDKLKTTKTEELSGSDGPEQSSLFAHLDPVLQQYTEKLENYDKLLTENSDTIHNSEGLAIRLKTISENFQAVKQALTEVMKGNPKYEFEPGTHGRLLIAKFFESSMHDIDHFNQLIEAEKSASMHLRSAKVASLDKTVFAEQIKAVDHALTPALRMRWKRFVTLLEQAGLSETQIADFKSMMTGLDKLGVTSSWLSTVFDKMYAEMMPTKRTGTTPAAPAAKQLMEALLKDYADTADFLSANQSLQKEIDEVEQHLADFATPSKFAKAFEDLKKVAQPFIENEWPDDLNDNPLKKQVQAQTLGRLIEVFDASIKKLKSSSLEPGQLVEKEVEMLDEFFRLFGHLFTKIDSPGQNTNPDSKASHVADLKKALERIKGRIPDMDTEQLEQQSRCGKSFNVGMCLYSVGAKDVPETLEEVFTILHQELEEIRSGLMVDGSDYDIDLPPEMHELIATVPRLAMQTVNLLPGKLVGRSISTSGVSYTYNIPIRDHGIKLTARYEKPESPDSKGKVFLELDFYADNGRDRLEHLAKLAKQYRFGDEPLDDKSRREVSWGDKQLKTRFEVRNPLDMKRLEGLVNYMNLLSMTADGSRPSPYNIDILSYLVGSSSDFTTGKYPTKRKEAIKDFLNVMLGGVKGEYNDEGVVVLQSTTYNVQLVPSQEAFTFEDPDDGQTYTLDLNSPKFGLSDDVFDKLPEDKLAELEKEVLLGTQKFKFDYEGHTYTMDLNREDLGLSPNDLKALSLNGDYLDDVRTELKLTWDAANFYRPSAQASLFRTPWSDLMYGTPMAYSTKSKYPEMEIWKAVSDKPKKRSDLGTIDKGFEKILEKKYALHDVDKQMGNDVSRLSPEDRESLGKALQSYYTELSKFELTCTGYVGKKRAEKKYIGFAQNAHGKVRDLKLQTGVQKKAIEHRMLLLGIKPKELTTKELRSLSFRKYQDRYNG
ncbi:hypothetical protein GC197_16335 [bacterium]|nr:hypothetical protein [bacterium]